MDEIGGGYLSALGLLECMLEAEQTAENLTEYKRKLSLLQNIEAERMHESIRWEELLEMYAYGQITLAVITVITVHLIAIYLKRMFQDEY